MNKLIEVVAMAICRVQLNGGDPGQPAVRWNGTKIEPQSFPAWRDYLDEARHSLAAIEAAGMVVVPSEPTRKMQDKFFAMCGSGYTFAEMYRAMLAATPQE